MHLSRSPTSNPFPYISFSIHIKVVPFLFFLTKLLIFSLHPLLNFRSPPSLHSLQLPLFLHYFQSPLNEVSFAILLLILLKFLYGSNMERLVSSFSQMLDKFSHTSVVHAFNFPICRGIRGSSYAALFYTSYQTLTAETSPAATSNNHHELKPIFVIRTSAYIFYQLTLHYSPSILFLHYFPPPLPTFCHWPPITPYNIKFISTAAFQRYHLLVDLTSTSDIPMAKLRKSIK